jgi:Mg-chelatase subunit ChlD
LREDSWSARQRRSRQDIAHRVQSKSSALFRSKQDVSEIMKLAFLRTASFAVSVFLAVHSSPAAPADNLILILDASGSMWGRVNGETKIEAARRVVKDLVAGLPADAGLGLVAYGHRAKGDCNDIEVLLPPGTLDKSAVGGRLDKLNPVGMTPITKSFEQAVAAAAGQNKPGTIVLVTDGLETCGGDPCAAARKAKEAGEHQARPPVGDHSDVDAEGQADEGRGGVTGREPEQDRSRKVHQQVGHDGACRQLTRGLIAVRHLAEHEGTRAIENPTLSQLR